MQRLTKLYGRNAYGLVNVRDDEQEVDSPHPNTLKAILQSFARLGEYEDILYAPDGTPRITLDRLRELVQTDAEGRVLIASTKVGDILYTTSMYRNESIEECRVTCHRISTWVSGANHEPWGGRFEEEDFGDTVFLTRAAAEQAKGDRE